MTNLTILLAIVCAAVSGLLLWSLQSNAELRVSLKTAEVALAHIKTQNAQQQEVINDYVKKLNTINERHNSRVMRNTMSCAIAPAEGANGQGDATRFGNPYPAISAYQAACEQIAAKLEAFQNLYKESK